MEKTIGFVIKCKDYRETSQLVWLYSKDFGKIKVIAKGSRNQIKKFKTKLDLFSLCDIVFHRSLRSELHSLNECEIVEPFSEIRQDLDRLATASYIAELLTVSTGLEDPCNELFFLTMDVFKWLANGKDPGFLLCVFEIKFMQYQGDFPNINNVTSGVKAIIRSILQSKAIDKLRITALQLEELRKVLRIAIDFSVGKRLKSLEFMEVVSNGASAAK